MERLTEKDNSDGTGAIDPISSMSYTTAAGKKVELDLAPGQTRGQFVDENGASNRQYVYHVRIKEEWLKANNGEAKVGDNDMVFIKDTGEMILGKDLSNTLKREKADLSITYTKTGFDAGEVRPGILL